jgi:hypothetical protein
MTAAPVIALKQPSTNALIEQAKAAWDRADERKADADDWYTRTGRLLRDLKAKVKEEGGQWLPVLKKIGRSQQRANELMRLATGDETIEQQRDRKKKSVAKSKKKKITATSGENRAPKSTAAEPEQDAGDGEQSAVERWQNSLANLCGDIVARAAFWDKHFAGWREFDCPSHIKKLVKEAATEFASITATVMER